MSQSKDETPLPIGIKFLFGGSAGIGATAFVQPLDLVKNRLQLSGADGQSKLYKSTGDAISKILKSEGIAGMYNGFSAGVLRQATYTTTRLGVFNVLMDQFKGADGSPPNFATKAAMGMTAGACGAFVGTPAEVALIRMTADGRLPVAERRGYTSAFNALSRMTTEEGILTLWRGCLPTMGRAVVVNAAQLSSYSQAKQVLLSGNYFKEGIPCHFVASMFSGFVTTLASMPVDIMKTRIQNMKTVNGVPEYRGAIDVLGKIVKNEGVFALWKGFVPYYFRLGPHTVLTFIFLEQMNSFYRGRFM